MDFKQVGSVVAGLGFDNNFAGCTGAVLFASLQNQVAAVSDARAKAVASLDSQVVAVAAASLQNVNSAVGAIAKAQVGGRRG